MKKVLCILMCIFVTITVFSGCNKTKTSSTDKNLEIKWTFGGPGKLEDSERVWTEFNKKLADYIPNTTIKFNVIPHAEYAEKWRLMSAAQENMDIVWVSYALNFVDEVSKGSYMDLTKLIEQYGNDMKAEFPEWLLDLTTIDNKVYAVPNYQMMASPIGFSIDESHVDKGWLDIKKAQDLFYGGKVLRKDDYKIFEDYFKKVLESGEDIKYVSSQFLNRGIKQIIGMPYGGVEPLTCNAVILKERDDFKVYDILTDFPDNYEYYDLIYDWYQKGYIRKNILSNPTEKEGEYLLWWTSVFKGSEERASIKFGRPMKIFTSSPNLYISYKGSNTNTAIAANSKNPERSMQIINLMNSKKGSDLLNLLTYGFEGEHYKKIDEGRIDWLENGVPGSSNNKYGYENWAIGNALNSYTTQSDPVGWNEYIHNDINMKADMSCLAGFTLDLTPIKLEVARYQTKFKEYEYLDKGTTPNYKELLKERNQMLKEAGSDKIVAEVQRQVDEWLKNRNN